MQYILRADQPYLGHIQTVMNTDGTVAYTNGKTFAEYQDACNYPLRVIEEAELDRLTATFLDTMISKPKRITHARFWDMLEILPPCRWHTVAGGFEVFHVSERITHNLVSWFAHKGERYWEFTDRDNLASDKLGAKLQGRG